MSSKLPQLIAAFVQAKNDHDSNALIACFADNAVVHDEGKELFGVAAIKKWIEASNAKYQVALDVVRFIERKDGSILTAQVSGNFEGSPVSLDYHLTINEGKISRLSIRLTGD